MDSPHPPWSRIGVTFPAVTQFTLVGVAWCSLRDEGGFHSTVPGASGGVLPAAVMRYFVVNWSNERSEYSFPEALRIGPGRGQVGRWWGYFQLLGRGIGSGELGFSCRVG